MGTRKWLVLKEFDVNDEERDLPKVEATLFGNYARQAQDVAQGDIIVTERPLIQERTQRFRFGSDTTTTSAVLLK